MVVDAAAIPIEAAPAGPTQLAGRTSKLQPNFLRLSVKGAFGQWSLLFHRLGLHLWLECIIPILVNLPLNFAVSYCIFFELLNEWSRDMWVFVSGMIGFLLTQKLSLAYSRFWEARGHLGVAVKCCRSIAIMVKPRLVVGHVKASEAADDARRYALLYYWTLCFQLLGMDLRQDVVMHHLKGRKEEEELLFKRNSNQALTCLVWLSSRIADLAVEDVLTQHELQEGLRRVDEMVAAFNGATKIKNTPIPLPLEHLCAVLTNLYVITAPMAIATAFKHASGQPTTCEFANGTATTCTEEMCPNLVWPAGGSITLLEDPTECPATGFTSVYGRTMFAGFFLGICFYAMFELGNAFAEPFGDDESDLGGTMMTMGNGLEADLRFMMETAIPHSRLRRETQKGFATQKNLTNTHEKSGGPETSVKEGAEGAGMDC
tara:strand:- start:479 stop:1771 length:1293 start_codon:yes stop_codon:yes gene_type:complete